MPPVLACLPPILDYNGQWPALRTAAHVVFRRDFFDDGVFDGEARVMVDANFHADGLELGFHHITTREHEGSGNRYPDVDRTRRICWIKPIVENAAGDPENICSWRHPEGRGEIYRYYWVKEDNFVVVCSEGRGRRQREDRIYLVTAFAITNGPKVSDLEKKYQRRIK